MHAENRVDAPRSQRYFIRVPQRYFDLEEAQALLPALTRELSDALQLHAHLRRCIAQLNNKDYSNVNASVLSGAVALEVEDEDVALLERARALFQVLRLRVDAIEETGAEVKGLVDGLLDFRSWRDGTTEVMLCWKIGERKIEHYHLEHTGYSSRQPVDGHLFVKSRSGAQHSVS